MTFDQSNNKGPGNQEDIHQTPENARERASTLQRKKVINISGHEMPLEQNRYEKDANGDWIEVTEVQTITSADGRILTPADIGGFSWTGKPIPLDRLYIKVDDRPQITKCLNPFGHHAYRLVFLDIDGDLTDLGNILCSECVEHNYRRYKKAKIPFMRILYNPTIY